MHACPNMVLYVKSVCAAATAVFEGLVACGEEKRGNYLMMSRLWAEQGNVEETHYYIREAMRLKIPEEDMVEFLIIAHLVRSVD